MHQPTAGNKKCSPFDEHFINLLFISDYVRRDYVRRARCVLQRLVTLLRFQKSNLRKVPINSADCNKLTSVEVLGFGFENKMYSKLFIRSS